VSSNGGDVLYISAGLVLFLFWLVLSGHYTPFLVVAGGLTAIATVAIAKRMRVLDIEGFPMKFAPGAITYWPWLMKEIWQSGLNVTRIILSPSLPISPRFVNVHASQRTSVGVATYANSITLTPGTVAAGVNGHELLVHALTKDIADDLLSGRMDKRVKQFEGEA
jgi:multicomponent Na+:H+ antiporter subunit E